MRHFLDKKQVSYTEWKIWFDNHVKQEKEKLTKWIKRRC